MDAVRNGSRKRGIPCRVTIVDLHNIWMKQRGRCAYCRRQLGADYHVDHIVPVAAGGTSEPGNLQFACPDCNGQKGATDPIEFARQIGRLI